jgi:uncharacterized protein (TIGR03435 family)
MKANRTGIAILLAGVVWAQAKTDTTSQPAFEAASIKLSGQQSVRGSSGGPGSSDPGQYRFDSATLLDFLAVAYHVQYFQISSKAPLDRDRFDLVVKVPAGTTREQFRVMLQNLLAGRFHLKLHIEQQEFPGYELVVAKTGLKLKADDGTLLQIPHREGFPDLPPDRPGMRTMNSRSGGFILVRLRAQQEPMPVLAGMLQSPGDPPLVDKTGLTGKYSFILEYTTELGNATGSADAQLPEAPSLSVALQEQLGLQLVKKKLPFDVVVIESVDRLPTEN